MIDWGQSRFASVGDVLVGIGMEERLDGVFLISF